MELALFPLSAHVLPGGRLTLRIFERRYIRMVKEAAQHETGFGICMFNNRANEADNEHILAIGTLVDIIDFEPLEEGLLGITVKGEELFQVQHVETHSDGLRTGICELLPVPKCVVEDAIIEHLAHNLKQLFEKYPEVGSLYDKPQFDDPLWLLYRWMELLPLNAEQKQYWIHPENLHEAFLYLNDLIE